MICESAEGWKPFLQCRPLNSVRNRNGETFLKPPCCHLPTSHPSPRHAATSSPWAKLGLSVSPWWTRDLHVLPDSVRGLESCVTAEGEEHPPWHVVEGISPHNGWSWWVCPQQFSSTQGYLMVPVPNGQDREILRSVLGHWTDLPLGLVQSLVPNWGLVQLWPPHLEPRNLSAGTGVNKASLI